MKSFMSAGLMVAGLLTSHALAASDDATLFRVFLKDGTTLVSYGEFARVGDRVIFSMPTNASPNPALQLVNLAETRVDWDRTSLYAESVRTANYMASRAESDYTALSNDVSETLNTVTRTADPSKRLTMAESARKALAEWPSAHYNYRASDVRQMLGLLDEAIADLRAAAGQRQFDLALTATTSEEHPLVPLLPPPTLKESIEQLLAASRAVDSSSERASLLGAALEALDRDASGLTAAWVTSTRVAAKAALAAEARTDRLYQRMTARFLAIADVQAAAADVRGLQQLAARVQQVDAAFGQKRPDAVNALLAAVQAKLDAARRLRLERDRWEMRAVAYREYRAAIARPVALFANMRPALENIKSLAGSTPASLAAIRHAVEQIVNLSSNIVPPEELRAAQALLVSAAQMAGNAARIRVDATLSGNMSLAWDASSAAAGALMLDAQALDEIQTAVRPPRIR